ncbi:hypothetical protein GCM10010981_23400 [Dyella nitratireducens]|uniref:Uncharacterized protein n=1 Tax=Dyella nitratireducens TaxID=1849580 RepID=A0ABQ1FZN7_9GAMM|nr:hypothetical protein GCM10010981_23400 [Dyella nitratireducens]GLQ40774.1 hypothetical protein GCM10007902_06240 [Dyella nitratireducens]
MGATFAMYRLVKSTRDLLEIGDHLIQAIRARSQGLLSSAKGSTGRNQTRYLVNSASLKPWIRWAEQRTHHREEAVGATDVAH